MKYKKDKEIAHYEVNEEERIRRLERKLKMLGMSYEPSLQGRVSSVAIMGTGLPPHLQSSKMKHSISLSDRWMQPARQETITPGPAAYAPSNQAASIAKPGQGIADSQMRPRRNDPLAARKLKAGPGTYDPIPTHMTISTVGNIEFNHVKRDTGYTVVAAAMNANYDVPPVAVQQLPGHGGYGMSRSLRNLDDM